MYYVYILECADGTKYYGHTDDLRKRIVSHSKGYVYSTKNKRPLQLIYYEEHDSRSAAFKREMQFKNGKTRKKNHRGNDRFIFSRKMSRVQFVPVTYVHSIKLVP
ncbi:MAG: GIY-YIG nuclease family protein [Candidatus Omnitrophica bacterium]|nr:GIY-YIG nuclease family protein [Candidatus Omnitrophota bacterium]